MSWIFRARRPKTMNELWQFAQTSVNESNILVHVRAARAPKRSHNHLHLQQWALAPKTASFVLSVDRSQTHGRRF